MTKYNEKEITNLIFDLEEQLNIEKCWIEIAQIIMENDENTTANLWLVIDTISKKNTEIYEIYENFIEKFHNSIIT